MNPQTTDEIPVIVVTGPVGAGKSTVMGAMSELLESRGIRHAAIDQDYLRVVHPYPVNEPFGVTVGYRNLAAIWPNLLAYDVRCAFIADVVEDKVSSLAAHGAAMPGATISIVRLNVPMPTILQRLEGRESEIGLDWHRRRAPELQEIMERNNIGDLVIDAGERSPPDIAREILQKVSLAAIDSL